MDPPRVEEEELRLVIQRVMENDATLASLDEDSVRPGNDDGKFRAEHAPALADALSSNTTVTRLTGGAFYSWEALEEFLSVAARTGALRDNIALKVLDLRGHYENAALGNAGAAAIKDIMTHNSSLDELNMSNLRMTDEEAMTIVAALEHNRTLKVLDLSDNDVGDRAASSLSDVLRGRNIALEKLNLDWCGIGHSGAAAMGEGLAENNSLKDLQLHGNRDIGDSGVIALAHGLKNNKALEKLSMGGCSISNHGAAAMGEGLAQNNCLKELQLHGNESIDNSGVVAVAHGLKKNNSLCVLRLAGCCIGGDGFRAFAELLRHNDKLQKLSLVPSAGTFVDRESASILANVLKFHNHTLKNLYLRFRSDDRDVGDIVNAYIKINSESNSSLVAYARKTHLFPRSYLGGLTKKIAVLPSALRRLDGIGSLSVTYCFVQETHAVLLGCRNVAGRKEEKKRKREDLLC